MPVQLTCAQCGADFSVRKSIAPRRRFCTMACKTAYNRTPAAVWQRILRRAHRVGQCLDSGRKVASTGYPGTFVGGYGQIDVHRLVYMLVNGLTFETLASIPVVRHVCDNRWCIEPTHLVGGTYRENMQDALERGRWPWRLISDGEPMSRGRTSQHLTGVEAGDLPHDLLNRA